MLEATFVKQHNETDDEKIKEAIALVYGVIMFTRNPELSAYQRLITALCIRGRAEDMVIYCITVCYTFVNIFCIE